MADWPQTFPSAYLSVSAFETAGASSVTQSLYIKAEGCSPSEATRELSVAAFLEPGVISV